MTAATITAFSLLAVAIIAAVALALNNIHTYVMPALKNIVSDISNIVAEINDIRTTAALAKQQAESNTTWLAGQSTKLESVKDQVLLNMAPPSGAVATAPQPPAQAALAQMTLPPEVSEAIKALGDHAASITNAVADINKSQSLTRGVADGSAGQSPVLVQTALPGGAVIITDKQAGGAASDTPA